MTRAAIYARVSGSSQEEKGIPQQLEVCHQLCEKAGYVVAEGLEFTDVESGTKFMRKGLQALLLAGERREFDVCVVWRFDRFNREEDDFYAVRLAAKKDNWVLESTLEGKHNPLDKIDNFMLGVYGFVSALDRERILQNFARGKAAALAQGKLPATPFPLFGYRYPTDASGRVWKDRYEIDPEGARIVRKIFELAARGMGATAIVRQLNQDGEPTPGELLSRHGYWKDGRPIAERWQRGHIAKILLNPAYWGEAYANRYYKMGPNTRKRAMDDEQAIPLPPETCPPIVDRQLAMAAREAAQRNKVEAAKDGIAKETMLLRGGIVRCGYCHAKMNGVIHHKKRRYYCSHAFKAEVHEKVFCPAGFFSWAAAELDEYVWQVVVWLLVNPFALSQHVQDWEQAQREQAEREPQDRTSDVQHLIQDLSQQLKNARRSVEHAKNDEEFAYWKHREGELNASVLRHQRRLADLETKQVQKQDYQASVRSLIELGQQARERLLAATIEEKREVLHWMGVQVEAWKKGSVSTLDGVINGIAFHPAQTTPPFFDEGMEPILASILYAEDQDNGTVPQPRPDVVIYVRFDGFHLPMPEVFAGVVGAYAATIQP